MKKHTKKILGFSGLAVVAATTVFAAALPGPEVSAATESSFTDTLNVRVVGSVPDVNVVSPASGSVFTVGSVQPIRIEYENIENVLATLKYTDADGIEHMITLDDSIVDYTAGTISYDLNLRDPQFGYGRYVLSVSGVGYGGVSDEEIVTFEYLPVDATLSEDPETGNVNVDLEYDPDDGTGTGTGDVASIEIDIFDENGNKITPPSPITVTPPQTSIEIPFDDYNLPSGTYTIAITAYGADGEELYKSFLLYYVYEAIQVPATGTPDTGGFFQNLNISQSDYLITGVGFFLIVGIAGAIYVAKNKKTSRRRR